MDQMTVHVHVQGIVFKGSAQIELFAATVWERLISSVHSISGP